MVARIVSGDEERDGGIRIEHHQPIAVRTPHGEQQLRLAQLVSALATPAA